MIRCEALKAVMFDSVPQPQTPSEALDEFIRQFTPTIRICELVKIELVKVNRPCLLEQMEQSTRPLKTSDVVGDVATQTPTWRSADTSKHYAIFATREKGHLGEACFAKSVYLMRPDGYCEDETMEHFLPTERARPVASPTHLYNP